MVIVMRRPLSALVALALAVIGFVALPAAASAAPLRAAAAEVCPGAPAYPPHPDATILSSTTTPAIGQKIDASGIVYCPNEDVRITIAGAFVGTGHTDSSGSFDPQVVTVPGPAGDKQMCGVGASGLSNDQDCLTLHVGASNTTPNGGGLASTGVEIAAIVGVAVILLAGGAFFATAGRRRKPSARV